MKRELTRRRENSLKQWRTRKGLTQATAAECLGITQGHLSHLESGKRGARRDLLKRIHIVTGVAYEDLLELAS